MKRRLRVRIGLGKSNLSYGQLERKQLLAGDVVAVIDGGNLLITGDAQANQIQLSSDANGNVLITGIDTTVNGMSDTVAISNRFGSTSLRMGDGNDEVSIDGVDGGREFRFLGQNGNDRFAAINLTARYIHIQGNAGDDVIEFSQSRSSKSTYVLLGDGDDVLSVPSFVAGRNFKVFGEGGNDTFASGSLSVGRKFRVNLGNGNDQALLAGRTTVRKNAKFRLGDGNDFLAVVPQQTNETSFFRRRVVVSGGSGDDTVAFDTGVTLRKPSRLVGQSGTDSIIIGDASINRHSRIRGFESLVVSDLDVQIQEVFDRLSDVGIDTEPFGDINDTADTSSLQLTVTQSPLSFTENDPATAIDSSLQLTGTGNEQVTSATVQVTGGATGEDSLLFDDTATISSSFDSSTGILSLTGATSPTDYQAALQNVRFQNVSDNPAADDRIVSISLQSERPVAPITAQRTIQVTSVDDPLSLALPGQFGVPTPVSFNIGQLVSFTAEGSDPDNSFVYQLDIDQSGISTTAQQPSIDSVTGAFSWNPSESGTFPLRVIAINDIGEADQEDFTVVVS